MMPCDDFATKRMPAGRRRHLYVPCCRLVAILERVQSGLIGATVSSFGITGLYITFVFGIGRFLRLSASNMRIRIPFTEMPDTSRLVALCQVSL